MLRWQLLCHVPLLCNCAARQLSSHDGCYCVTSPYYVMALLASYCVTLSSCLSLFIVLFSSAAVIEFLHIV